MLRPESLILSEFRQSGEEVSAPNTNEPALVEASGWRVNDDGQVELIANSDRTGNVGQPATCAAVAGD
jgi:hypothetical protein